MDVVWQARFVMEGLGAVWSDVAGEVSYGEAQNGLVWQAWFGLSRHG